MNYANFSGKKLRQVAYFCIFIQIAPESTKIGGNLPSKI